jgi:glycosyltransferase involved in cell wall biosynthesis
MQNKTNKICVICDARNIHFHRFLRDLKVLRYSFSVFSPWEAQIEYSEVAIISTPSLTISLLKPLKTLLKQLYRLKYSYQIRKQIRKLKPSILHAHFLTDCGWIGAWTGFHPFVLTIHGSDLFIHPKNSPVNRIVVRFALKKADRIIIVSEVMKKELKTYNVPEKKIRIIHNYVDDIFFIKGDILKNKFKNIEKPIIISARKLEPIYKVETLIKSIPYVLTDFPDLKVQIFDDGEEKENLIELSKNLKIDSNIEFMGKLDHYTLSEFFKNGHIFVSAALSDGMAVSTIEGMASGMFPLLSDIPANRYLINEYKNDILFSPNDEKDLANKILSILMNREKMYRIIKFLVNNTKESFSKETFYKNITELYKQVI